MFDLISGRVMELLSGNPVLVTLVILQGLDIVSGITIAVTNRELSSSVSWVGMSKKIATWIIVGMALALERHISNMPLASMTAVFYSAIEGLSIIENAAILGLPVPDHIKEFLERVQRRTQSSSRRAKQNPHYDVHGNVEVKTGSAVIRRRDSDPLFDVREDDEVI